MQMGVKLVGGCVGWNFGLWGGYRALSQITSHFWWNGVILLRDVIYE